MANLENEDSIEYDEAFQLVDDYDREKERIEKI